MSMASCSTLSMPSPCNTGLTAAAAWLVVAGEGPGPGAAAGGGVGVGCEGDVGDNEDGSRGRCGVMVDVGDRDGAW